MMTIKQTGTCKRCRHPKGEHSDWGNSAYGSHAIKSRTWACSDCYSCTTWTPEIRFDCCPSPDPELRQDSDDHTVYEVACASCRTDIVFLVGIEVNIDPGEDDKR